jgi:iron complex outermembrane receptor protein
VDDVSSIYSALNNALFEIDAYLTLDVRLAWRPAANWELSLVGQNLLEPSHLEFVQESFTLPTEVERSIYAKLAYQF